MNYNTKYFVENSLFEPFAQDIYALSEMLISLNLHDVLQIFRPTTL